MSLPGLMGMMMGGAPGGALPLPKLPCSLCVAARNDAAAHAADPADPLPVVAMGEALILGTFVCGSHAEYLAHGIAWGVWQGAGGVDPMYDTGKLRPLADVMVPPPVKP